MGQNLIIRFWPIYSVPWNLHVGICGNLDYRLNSGIWVIVWIQETSQHFLQTFGPLRMF